MAHGGRPALAGSVWGAGREIVLFDTDSCLFCDDGAALVMLLRSPSQVVVPGITVVPGNVWPAQGAEYMFHILDLLKHPQVPVYTGAHAPLVHTAAMAREAERRWGKLEYIGAFADNPEEVKPAPGARPHRTQTETRRRSRVSDLRNRAAIRAR